MDITLAETEAAPSLNVMWGAYRRAVVTREDRPLETRRGARTVVYGSSHGRPTILEEGATGTTATAYPDQYYSIASMMTGATTTATSTTYAYDGSTLLATIDQALVNGTATGTPITRYVSPDNLGSTNITTDTSGNLAQWLDYYPYGAVRIDQDAATTSAARTYIGQYSDASGLSYLQNRYYNPFQGQFLSQDPVFLEGPIQQDLSDPQSLNPYSYSDDNPITKEDPSGKQYADANTTLTAPTPFDFSAGPTEGILYDEANGQSYLYFGGAVSAKPEASFSLTQSPTGNPAEGLSLTGSYFYKNGLGGVFGASVDTKGAINRVSEGGYGTPGGSLSLTFTISLDAPFVYETTPMINGPTVLTSSNANNNFDFTNNPFNSNNFSSIFQNTAPQISQAETNGSVNSSQGSALAGVVSAFSPQNAAQAAAVQNVILSSTSNCTTPLI